MADAVQDGLYVDLFMLLRLVLGELLLRRVGGLGLLGGAGAFHQPDAADDEGHADHHLRQLVHDQIECPEDRARLAPAPEQVAEGVHEDVLVAHQRTEGDERPAQQLVAVGQRLRKALIMGVKVDKVIVLRGGAHPDLRPQVEGIEKAVHIDDGQSDI